MIYRLMQFLFFQVGWLSCVLGAAYGRAEWGAVGGLAMALLILALTDNRRRLILVLLFATFIGPLADLIQVASGMIRLKQPLLFGFWIPVWLWAMWPLFAAVLKDSFGWLFSRWVPAIGLGAVAGPLSYWAGARLGAVDLHPDLWPSLLAIALEWALMFPILLGLTQKAVTNRGSPVSEMKAVVNAGKTLGIISDDGGQR